MIGYQTQKTILRLLRSVSQRPKNLKFSKGDFTEEKYSNGKLKIFYETEKY